MQPQYIIAVDLSNFEAGVQMAQQTVEEAYSYAYQVSLALMGTMMFIGVLKFLLNRI